MASTADLNSLMESVDVQLKHQTGILRSILNLQKKEAGEAKRRWEISRADRDVVPSAPTTDTSVGGAGPTTQPSSDSSLTGLTGVLGGLAASIGLAIGTIKGQMLAIETFFKAFTPGLVKIFNDFKANLSARFTAISTAFTKLVDDLKIRIAFIQVTISETLDNFAKTIKSMFSSGPDSRFSKIITAVRTSLNALIEPFRVALTTVQELAKPDGSPGKIANMFSAIKGWLGELGAAVGRVVTIVGKIFAPIAIIITAWETLKGALDGYAEEGFLGGLKGAIDGFFTSLITAPLDLIKNLVAWVVGKFGFDETAEVLNEFSFTDLFRNVLDSIFNGVSSAISVITDLFTFTEEDMTLFGTLGKLTDLVYAPVNMAINFVKGIFGFEETDEPFRLQDWITEQFNSIINSISQMFSFIPSIDELQEMMFNALPQWLQDLIGEETVRGSLPSENYVNPANEFAGFDGGYRTGTKGFVDFGAGTKTVLHGLEAVVPKNTDAGRFLNSNFDDNWKLKMSALENSSMQRSAPVIINAPNNSQTNISSSGGSSSTTVISAGGGRQDLDRLSIPGGVQ